MDTSKGNIRFELKTKISDFTQGDIDKINSLSVHYLGYSKEDKDSKLENLIPHCRDFISYVAYNANSRLVGFIYGRAALSTLPLTNKELSKYDGLRRQLHLHSDKIYSLMNLCVSRGYRRNHIGTKLLSLIENACKKKGYAYSLIHPLNKSVEKFYIKNGYEDRENSYDLIENIDNKKCVSYLLRWGYRIKIL